MAALRRFVRIALCLQLVFAGYAAGAAGLQRIRQCRGRHSAVHDSFDSAAAVAARHASRKPRSVQNPVAARDFGLAADVPELGSRLVPVSAHLLPPHARRLERPPTA